MAVGGRDGGRRGGDATCGVVHKISEAGLCDCAATILLPAGGTVAWHGGPMLAGADSVTSRFGIWRARRHDVRLRKIDRDRIRTVVALQTIVSRESDPLLPTVVTVGSFHAGTKHNIIPDEAHLQLTVEQ